MTQKWIKFVRDLIHSPTRGPPTIDDQELVPYESICNGLNQSNKWYLWVGTPSEDVLVLPCRPLQGNYHRKERGPL